MIKYESHEISSHVLTPEGSQIAKDGSHEARVWGALPAKGQGTPVTPDQLKKTVGDETAKVGQGRAFKNGWIGKEGGGLVKLVRLLLLDLSYVYRIHPVYLGRNNPGCDASRLAGSWIFRHFEVGGQSTC